MNSSPKFPILVVATVSAYAVPALQSGPLAINTVSAYNPGSAAFANKIDRTAIGNPTTFTNTISTAYNSGLGGVVNFDTNTNNGYQNINAKYGTSLSKTLSIGTNLTFNSQQSTNIYGVSGPDTGFFLFDANAGNRYFTFTLGAITGGSPGEYVSQAGLTLLARKGGSAPTITVTATFSDMSTAAASAAFTTVGSMPNFTEDTFYGFTAPIGQSISTITIDYGAAGGDLRRGIDDFGFITTVPEVPEPSTVLACLGIVAVIAAHLKTRLVRLSQRLLPVRA